VGRQTKLAVVARPNAAAVARAVWQALLRYEGEGASAKELAKVTGHPVRTVQWHLQKMLATGEISVKVRGLYVAKPKMLDVTADPAGQPGVHGLVLMAWNLRETPLGAGRMAREVLDRGMRQRDGSLTRVEAWGGRAVRFTYYPTTDNLQVSFVRDEEPVDLGELDRFSGWLEGLFGCPVDKLFWVVQVGVHVDHRNLVLDGVKSLTFYEFGTVVARLYQKRARLMRHEYHFNAERPGVADLKSAVRILTEGSPTAQVITALRLELKALKERSKLARREQETIAPAGPLPPERAGESGYG